MNDDKITISLDEVNSPRVDAELYRQNVSNRMAQHQATVRNNVGMSGQMMTAKGGFFRRTAVYMAVFGLVFSILGWLAGELMIKGPLEYSEAEQAVLAFTQNRPNIGKDQLKSELERLKHEVPKLRNNRYLPDKIVDMTEVERNKVSVYFLLWHIMLGAFVSLGLSIAEGCVAGNVSLAFKNGVIGVVLGAFGGFIAALFVGRVYIALGGGGNASMATQLFARGVAWSIFGTFLAIAPGIVMRSWKKFLLGVAGGAIGGLLGGLLFDLICRWTEGDELARFVNIVGLGVGAAVAMVILENVVKQGWLKVSTGLIAGKQFILYRNPTVIGSSPKSEIYLFKDPAVAPKHAAITSRNGSFFLTALEGATVLVNNVPTRQQRLNSGDRIGIGNTVFVFEAKAINKQ